MSKELTRVPKIVDLYDNSELALAKNDLNILLNNDPHPSWLIKHPFVKKEVKDPKTGRKTRVPIDYLPIARIEWLLTSIFQSWNIEVKNIMQIANSVVVTARLHYKNPVTGEAEYQDGVGAVAIQTEQGAAATDFSKVRTDAVMKSVPAAKSYALKDAADHLGKLFGKDLNREQYMSYANLQTSGDDIELKNLKAEVSEIISEVRDEKMREAAIEELNEAEANGVNTVDFYKRIINNYQDK